MYASYANKDTKKQTKKILEGELHTSTYFFCATDLLLQQKIQGTLWVILEQTSAETTIQILVGFRSEILTSGPENTSVLLKKNAGFNFFLN